MSGEVEADLDVDESGGRQQGRGATRPGRHRSRAPAPRRAPSRSDAPADEMADVVEPVGARRTARRRLPCRRPMRRDRAIPPRRTADWPRSRRTDRLPATRRTTTPAAIRTLRAARPMPARLARATSSASGLTSVSQTVVPSSGSSAASDSPIAPEPVPRSATRPGAGTARGQLDRRARRPARSPVAGSAPDGRPPGRAGGSPSGRARTAAARRRDSAPPSRRGGPPSVRSPGSSSAASNSSPSSPLATSHSQRASCRAPIDVGGLPPEHPRRERARPIRPRRRRAGGRARRAAALDDVVEVAGQHVGEPVDREADAVVGDPVLLEVVGADLLAAAATADLRAALGRRLGVALPLGQLEQPGAQHLHRPIAVLQLAALVLHRDHDAGRDVRDAHRRVGGVDALPARLRTRGRRRSARSLSSMATSTSSASGSTATVADDVWMRPWLSVTGHPLHAVRAALELESLPGVVAAHDERHLVDAAEVARRRATASRPSTVRRVA